jgi:Protein of unknown function (DUF3892)
MATSYEIQCIKKSDRLNPHERIKSIGGRNADGTAWELSQENAIAGIIRKEWSFFVRRAGSTVNVVVAKSRFDHLYLKTEADGESPDNLLSLPQCP